MPQSGYTGPLYVPRRIASVVDSLFGVETGDIPSPAPPPHPPTIPPEASYYSPQLAAAYDFPDAPAGQLPGQGLTIGILELGGTFDDAQRNELSRYLAEQGLPTPQINVIGSSDFQQGGPNFEVMLDIEVLASVLPGDNI